VRWLLGLLVAFLVTAPAWLPWLDPALFLWNLDDAENHLLRIYVFGWLIDHGVWYPRWAPDLFMGYGFPVLNYYAPGLYYLAYLLGHLLRLSPWEAFRASGMVAIALAVSGAYALVVAVWRRVAGGILAAVALLYAPYAFQINLFKRGDLPEALGLGLVPWLLLALWEVWQAPTLRGRVGWTLGAALVGAALLLVHNLTALVGGALALFWTLALLAGRPTWRPALAVAIAGMLALGSTAFFWLPAVLEAHEAQLGYLQGDDLDYGQWLIDPSGRTPITDPRAASSPQTRIGLIDLNVHYPHQLVPSPKLSLGEAGLGLLAAVGAFVLSFRDRTARAAAVVAAVVAVLVSIHLQVATATFPLPGAQFGPLAIALAAAGILSIAVQRWRRNLVLPLLALALGCWFLTFQVSEPLWRHVPGLTLLQFPWRLMGPLAVAVALAAGGGTAALITASARRWGTRGRNVAWLFAAGAGAAVIFNSLGERPIDRSPPYPARAVDGSALLQNERTRLGQGSTTGREFTPRDVAIATVPGVQGVDRGLWTRLYPEAEWVGGLFYPLSGDLRLVAWQAGQLSMNVRVINDRDTPGQLGIHQLRFPGWRAWIDGRPVPVGSAPDIPEQEANLGFMTLPVPTGEHELVLRFGPTPVRAAGITLTVITFVATGLGLAWYLRRDPIVPFAPAASLIVLVVALAGYGASRELLATLPAGAPSLAAPVRAADGMARASHTSTGARSELVANVAEEVKARLEPLNASGLDTNRGVGQLTVKNLYDPGLGVAGVARRQWLYTRDAQPVSIDVELPHAPAIWFQAQAAADPAAWQMMPAVEYRVQVAPAGDATTSTTVLSQVVDPRGRAEDRRWIPLMADLAAWAGQRVRVTLRILPHETAGPSAGALAVQPAAGWGDPVIVAGDTARAQRYPAAS
jgi:hypothetical protein